MPFRLANIEGRAALVDGDNYYDLETISGRVLGSDPMAALASVEQLSAFSSRLDEHTPTGQIGDKRIDAPVPRPSNVFAIGLNYRGHAEESGMVIPEVPLVFTKYSSCIVGPNADVVLRSNLTDFEAELVAVVGKGGRDISVESAWDHIVGLCVGQDFTDRGVQFDATPPQFCMGKSMDTFGPIGPFLVSPDFLKDVSSMDIRCVINGETRQVDNTSDLIFDIPALVSYLSHLVTLKTGDLIFTGTPSGVGAMSGRYLKDGDIVESSIEGLGTIRNRCVRGPDRARADMIPEALKKVLEAARG